MAMRTDVEITTEVCLCVFLPYSKEMTVWRKFQAIIYFCEVVNTNPTHINVCD